MAGGLRLGEAASEISRRVAALGGERCLVVAVSGIDGSGKTTFADALSERLEHDGVSVHVVHLDDWHTAPEVRFAGDDPGGHFYRHAYRHDELFGLLVEPLRAERRVALRTTLRRLPDNDEFEHELRLADVDVLLLDGIFLLKRELRDRYDFSVWVDCSFETALERAIARNQEGLSEEEIVRDYSTIYFAAQELHMRLDDPRSHADLVVSSDPRAG
jgi:uridine kinase